MKRFLTIILLGLTSVSVTLRAQAAEEKNDLAKSKDVLAHTHVVRTSTRSFAKRACTTQESWALTAEFSDDQFIRLTESLRNPDSLGASLLEIARMQKAAPNTETWALSQYWLGRMYYSQGYHETAHGIWLDMIEQRLSSGTENALGIQAAAIECLNQVVTESPTLEIPRKLSLLSGLPKYRRYTKQLGAELFPLIQDLAISMIRSDLEFFATKSNAAPLLSLFRRMGSHDSLARGLIAAHKRQNVVAATELNRFLNFQKFTTSFQERYREPVRLMVGQLEFLNQQYPAAITQFRRIPKDSNQLMDAVGGLGWSAVWLSDHQAALGSGITLGAPSLRNAFAPDSLVTMAITYYELCRFPETYKTLLTFRQQYSESFKWLREHQKPGSSNPYNDLVAFISSQSMAGKSMAGTKQGMPNKVGAELARSPRFLALQTELNRLLQAKQRLDKMNLAGLSFWYEHLQEWNQAFPALQEEVMTLIQNDLNTRIKTMYTKLVDIGSNVEILEAETFRKAGEDVIWQNINPKFRVYAKDQKAQRKQVEGSFYDWGEDSKSTLRSGEIWEDEIGSHLGITTNLCSIKDEYGKTPSL